MQKIWIVVAVAILTAAPALASDKTDTMTVVHQFADAFNKGDTKAAAGACAEQTSIIDEFTPYEWDGDGACMAWMNDYDADAKKNGITDGLVTFGSPRHIDVTSDHAYVVIPANYTFKRKGTPVKETGSTITLSLQKGDSGWRITAWAWAKQ